MRVKLRYLVLGDLVLAWVTLLFVVGTIWCLPGRHKHWSDRTGEPRFGARFKDAQQTFTASSRPSSTQADGLVENRWFKDRQVMMRPPVL